jgi:hypothetical protein
LDAANKTIAALFLFPVWIDGNISDKIEYRRVSINIPSLSLALAFLMSRRRDSAIRFISRKIVFVPYRRERERWTWSIGALTTWNLSRHFSVYDSSSSFYKSII